MFLHIQVPYWEKTDEWWILITKLYAVSKNVNMGYAIV